MVVPDFETPVQAVVRGRRWHAEGKKRKVHGAEFKAKVKMEAVKGVKTLELIGQQYGVHPVVVGQWKKEIVERAATPFEGKRGPKPAAHAEEDRLYEEIGRLKMELDRLKKSPDHERRRENGLDRAGRRAGAGTAVQAGRSGPRGLVRLASAGAGVGGRPAAVSADRRGHAAQPEVGSTDLTSLRLARGFVYLVAIIDGYSRRVLAWRIRNSLDTSFCIDCLEDALSSHGKPAVFNSDQGSQFTSAAFAGVLEREGIAISMDGRGCALDNIFVERLWRSVKHEDVYLKGVRHGCRTDRRAGGVFRLLQRRASAPVAGQPDAECGLCQWQRRWGKYPGLFRRRAGRIPNSATLRGKFSPRNNNRAVLFRCD